MEIKIITCHDVYNYGASLQAYALQSYLEGKKCKVMIVNYKPKYLNRVYNFWYIPESSRLSNISRKFTVFHFLVALYFSPKKFTTFGRIFPFRSFTKNYLKCTERVYRNIDELRDSPPQADIYIAGSDQIWNTFLSNGNDPAFYLEFGSINVKRFSYAASFGISKLKNERIGLFVKKKLEKFDSISVRELSGLKILESLGLTGRVVLDPVFLLSKEDWMTFSSIHSNIKPYLLVYDIFCNDDTLKQTALRLSEHYKLEIRSVADTHKLSYASKNITNAGPKEFIDLVANASIVLSNSFHATAFSVIMNIPFFVFYKGNNLSRITDFLSLIGLGSRLNSADINDDVINNIDWITVNLILEKEICSSKNFIDSILND